MAKIRVLFGGGASSVSEALMKAMAATGDMESLGVAEGSIELLLKVAELRAEAVVLPMRRDETDPGLCSHLLFEYPDLIVVSVSRNLERANVYRRVIIRQTLQDGHGATVFHEIRNLSNQEQTP